MLASGRPIVATAARGTGLAQEVEGCGLVAHPGDDAAFACAIERLIDDEEARNMFGNAARQRAEERWERNAIVDGLENELIHFVTNCPNQDIPAVLQRTG